MTPIISPWIFYLIGLINQIGLACFIIFILSATLFFFCCIGIAENQIDSWGTSEKNQKLLQKGLNGFGAAAVITLLLYILLPSNDTMLKMLTASVITPDNVQEVQSNVVDLVAQIAQGIKAAK